MSATEPHILGEEELSYSLSHIFNAVDAPFRKSEPAPKTILVDFFGISNSGKTQTTSNLDQVFRREGFLVYAPQETAEHYNIRNKSTDDSTVFQGRHVSGVLDFVLNLPCDRNFHVAIISRGLIDMLYWYERGWRKGELNEEEYESARGLIYGYLRKDLVDAYFYFTCSDKVAMERENQGSPIQKGGSKVNPEELRKARQIYDGVVAEVKENIPGLPIFHIDTTHLSPRETTDKVLSYLVPSLDSRIGVLASDWE